MLGPCHEWRGGGVIFISLLSGMRIRVLIMGRGYFLDHAITGGGGGFFLKYIYFQERG